MSNTILNYLNNDLKLSKTIQNIEKEFSNGYYFAEILQKVGYLKKDINIFKKETNTEKELDENFNNLKEQLEEIGVHLDEGTIKSLNSCEKNIASNLIYKIRAKVYRKNIGFDEIMDKIQLHDKESINLNINNKFMPKTMINFSRPETKLHRTKSSSNFSDISNVHLSSSNMPSIEQNKTNFNFFSKKDKNNNNNQNLKLGFSLLRNKLKLKPLKKSESASELITLKNNLRNNLKIEKINKNNNFIKLNKNKINIKSKIFSPRTCLKKSYKNLNEISEKELEDFSNNIFEPEEKLKVSKVNKIKPKIFQNNFNKSEEENKFIKYSCLENNSLKVGIDIKDIDPKLKKYTIISSSDLIPLKVVESRLKEKLNEQEEMLKKKKEEKKLLSEEEKIYKYSILKNDKNQEGKSFFVQFDKTKQFYKMNEYEKQRRLQFPIKTKKMLEEINKNKNFLSNFIKDETGKKGYKTTLNFYENSSNFVPISFFDEINKNDINERKKKLVLKQLNKEKDFVEIEDMVNLMVDITEQCYKYQNKRKTEFINLPEYKKWIELFIDGKTCLKIVERRNSIFNMGNNNQINKNKKKNKTEKEKEKENVNKLKAEKIKNEILKSDFCSNELVDYLYGRGYWNQNIYVPDDVFGSQVHIYQVLGDSILSMIASGKIVLQGIKPSTFLKMKNEEFELKEEEKENIIIPKENKRDEIFGELIELNYDNNQNNNLFLNVNNSNEINLDLINNTETNNKINYSEVDLSYIPVKICLIGNSFSGRKTQAELISSKYPGIKIYSIKKILKFYSDEYERFYINIDNNNSKKVKKLIQADLIKEKEKEEEIKKFEEVKNLIEDYALKKVNDLSDEIKLKLLLREILKDFPYKNDKEIYDEIHKRNERKNEIENEMKNIKEEQEKKNNKNKTNNNMLEKLQMEYDTLVKESYSGFIIVDYPNNYEQHLKIEEYFSGYIQEIDKYPDKRDLFLNYLTNILDKPYYNISNVSPEIINYLKKENQNSKSIFNNYIWLKANEEDIINRSLNRMLDPLTGIIYNMEDNPPPSNDKKLNERLVPITEPTPEQLKDEIKMYNLEIPKINEFLNNLKNFLIINKSDKNEINQDIENEIINSITKFEDRENKDIIGDFMKMYDPDENNNFNYFKRLNEINKKVKKEISDNIIQNWIEFKEKYTFNIKEFIYNIDQLKTDIILKMQFLQDNFIEFLNSPSEKKRTINVFLNKYDSFLKNYSSIRNNTLVKEEIEKDFIELTESLWGIIQSRKKEAIEELNKIINNGFIEKQIDFFWELLSNLFFTESENYIKKINIIKQFYFEFDVNRYSDKFPYEYILKKGEILKGTNDLAIYVEPKKEENKKITKSSFKRMIEENKVYIVSPKIDKIYKNCFKMLFSYDKKMAEIEEKERNNYIMNTSDLSNLSKNRKKYKKLVTKKEFSIFSEGKSVIHQEEEIKAALTNEKIKYKLKLVFLKYFGEKFIVEMKHITKLTFENMDKWIIKSVESQNNVMNKIINIIRENLENATSLGINRLFLSEELDVFDIYEKYMPKFKEIKLNKYKDIKDEDKIIDINELYKIYLDVKTFEIQKNYVTLNSLIDILIKKHIFNYNSKGLMNCFKNLPYSLLIKIIKKFTLKTQKGQILIRTDRLFTILLLMNISFPNKEQIVSLNKGAKEKLKFNTFLTKDDFLKCNFWFDIKQINENQINPNNKILILSMNNLNQFRRMSYLKSKRNSSTSSLEEQINELNKNPLEKFSKPFVNKKKIIRKNTHINAFKAEAASNGNDNNDGVNIKEILFEINKNYNNEINFVEFIDIITLKFLRNMKKKLNMIIKNKEKRKSTIEMDNPPMLLDTKKEINSDDNNIDKNNLTEQRNNESKDKNEIDEIKNKIIDKNKHVEISKSVKELIKESIINKDNQANEELNEKNINNGINNISKIYTYYEKLMNDKI